MHPAPHSRPLWIGLLASIFCVPMLAALLTALSTHGLMVPPLLVLFIGVLIAAPIALVIELPVVLGLRKLGQLNALYLCLAGAVVGALALGLYALYSSAYPEMNDRNLARWIAQQAALGAVRPGSIYGLLSAAAFSLGAGLPILPGRRRTRLASGT